MTQPTTPTPPPASRQPYWDSFEAYYQAGWAGILPLPAGQKKPVPAGFTGNHGVWPSWPDVMAWAEDRPGANVALRLPEHVIGVDVDAYGDKPGGLVLAELERRLGALPATWRSTSRDDGVSGIRLYRVPEHLAWPNIFGPGIESIRFVHRYVVAPPSLHPDTQRPYRWIDPAGNTSLAVPELDELPALPDAWVEHFTGGQLAGEGDDKATLDDGQASDWLSAHGAGEPCRVMAPCLAGVAGVGASRHDHFLQLTNRVLWLAGEGHLGASSVLAQARAAFMHATAGDRATGEAEREWDRMIVGGIAISVAAHHTIPEADPCLNPFDGIVPKENPWNPQPTPSPSLSSTPAPTASLEAAASSTSSTAAADGSPAALATAKDGASGAASTEPVERSTWWPVDIEGVITGERPQVTTSHLLREDGAPAFYPARVNGIIGPSESGKSWVALVAVVQAVEDGQNATILDFEDDEVGVVNRLLALGASPAALREHLAYVSPAEPYAPFMQSGADLIEHLDATSPELILVDGFNAAMGLQGLDLMSNGDATRFFQTVLRPLAARGACVVYVDHTPKNSSDSAGGIGAQAKRAMTSGCTLKVDVITPFGKGQRGKVRLYVDKDRPGAVRGVSAQSKAGHWYADVAVSSEGDESVSIAIQRPEGMDASGHVVFRPTVLMGRISDYLAAHEDASVADIVRDVRGKSDGLREALRTLIDEGWVEVGRESTKHTHRLVQAFSELTSPPNSTPTPQPHPSHTPGAGASETVPPSPQPLRSRAGGGTGRAGQGGLVERTIGGERLLFNPSTGETFPLEEGGA